MLQRTHVLLSLVLGVILILSAASGLVLSGNTLVEHLRAAPSQGETVAVVAERIARQLPGIERIERAPSGELRVAFSTATDSDVVLVDPASAAVIAPYQPSALLSWVRDLHRELLLGSAGRWLSGLSALALLVLALTGSWLLARHHQGEWLVRVEDLDPPREVPGAAHAQLATLAAFGMTSDLPVVWQSQRHARYAHALERLLAGGAAFECRCSRSELASVGGIHRRCVARDPSRPAAVRLRVAEGTTVDFIDGLQGRIAQAVDRDVGDVVLRRADGYWAYQLAVVVDDAEQGITDVVRGADLLDSTPRQILLQRALGLPTPQYLHTPLVLGDNGEKLSKQNGAAPLELSDPLAALNAAAAVLDLPPATGGVAEALAVWTRAWHECWREA